MKHYNLLSRYNRWMNDKLFTACKGLGNEKLFIDQEVFFRSILQTLNHIFIADIFWFYRCTRDKAVFRLSDKDGNPIKILAPDQIVFDDIVFFQEQRLRLDILIIEYIDSLTYQDLENDICYNDRDGEKHTKSLDLVLTHWFNHQTHHRGQVTAMLSQQSVDYGVTDIIFLESELS